jgi:hypothetical protein
MSMEEAKFHFGQLSKKNETLSPVVTAKYLMM